MLLSIILAVAIAVLIIIAKRLLDEEAFDEAVFSDKYTAAIVVGIIAGFINYFSPQLVERNLFFLAPIFMIVMIALLVWLVRWWCEEGGSWKEMIPFVILTVLFCLIMESAYWATAMLVTVPFLASVLQFVPFFAGVAALWCMVSNYLNFCITEMDDTEAERSRHNILKIAATVGAILLVAGTLAFGAEWSPNEDAYASDEGLPAEEQVEDASTSSWTFYNSELQTDSDESNNFNFGPNPGNLTADEYDADFRERLRNDPALGAADMAWADAWLGTRYLGEFYDSCKGDWAKTINASKEAFIKDSVLYNNTLNAFFQMLDSAEVKVTTGKNLDDQMYMNPYTVDSVPDVIVMETPDHTGTFLTYVFTIKGTGKISVSYRTECGYQPTNVEEVMDITPQDKPSIPDKPSTPNKPSNPDKPGQGDEPQKPDNPDNPQHKKDPNKAPKKNTEPNDDKGPGPNTNNPSDPQHSTKDTKDSTSSMTPDDHKKDVESKKETNKTQKTGSDSNTPSTPAPKKDTKVDNNGDKGTGNGGINTPTPTKEKAKEADSGKEIKDSSGEAWEGPKD